MSDQRRTGAPSPRNGRRSYQSYEDRYTYSTREGSSYGDAAPSNNPRTSGARSVRNNPRAAQDAARVRVSASSGTSNPRTHAASRSEAELAGYARDASRYAADATYSHSVSRASVASSGSAARAARSRTTGSGSGRSSRPQAASGASNLSGVGRYDGGRYSAQRSRKPVSKLLVVVAIVALVGAGFGIFNIVSPAQFEVTINGMTKTLERGDTIDDVIADGIVSPVAGDFIAVDNSVITEGGGDRFSALLNEKETNDGTTRLYKGDTIQVSDGKDVMEEYSVSEVTVEPGQSVEGVGSIHHYVDGVQGKTEVRTGTTSGLTVETVVTPVSDAMYKSYNADVGADKVIALTFDDGPWPETTDQVLDILAQYGAKATFFTIGQQIDDYPEATKRIVEEGHQLCTHTWDHAEGSGQGVNLTYMSAEEQIAEITKGYDAIKAITGQEASRIIRAPGGNYSGDIVWTLEPYVDAEIGWNVDTQDWARPGADAIAQAILSAEPGDVVLMHDGGGDRSQTVEALKIALPKLIERGYTFVTMDELIAYSDPASMEPGTWN